MDNFPDSTRCHLGNVQQHDLLRHTPSILQPSPPTMTDYPAATRFFTTEPPPPDCPEFTARVGSPHTPIEFIVGSGSPLMQLHGLKNRAFPPPACLPPLSPLGGGGVWFQPWQLAEPHRKGGTTTPEVTLGSRRPILQEPAEPDAWGRAIPSTPVSSEPGLAMVSEVDVWGGPNRTPTSLPLIS